MDFLGDDFRHYFFDSGYSSVSVYESSWTFLLVGYRGRFPWSRLLWTTQFLQLLRKVIDVLGCRSCRFSLLMRRGGFPWSRLLSDQRRSPVRRHGGRFPYCAGPAVLLCRRGEDSRAPTAASLSSGLVVACPLYATTGAVWSMTWRSSSTVVDVLCSC